VVSDERWRAHAGAWRETDLYMGERYDARREERGWSTAGFDARTWQAVDVGSAPQAPLRAHPGPAIEVVAELEPVSVVERGPGKAVFDFGQNMAGVVRLALEAPSGTTLVLRFGETLEADGSVFRRNLSWARAVDQYVARGGGQETWQPRFTYHGFRYVEVSGLPGPPHTARLTALALSSATRDVGEFRCSDPRLERLVEMARWSLRSNSMDLPTDCPQRGERLGWTGDGQLFAPSALWLADLQTLYDKWALDLLDAQRPDGRFPNTAPSFPLMPYGGPFWEDAGVLVPALLFERSGDRRLVERHFESMRRFLASCLERARGEGPELRAPTVIEGFGDWNQRGAPTRKDVLFLAALAKSARHFDELARALGRPEATLNLEAKLARAFAAGAIDAEGRLRDASQTALALALNEGLLDERVRPRARDDFLTSIASLGPATGFVGTAELLPALSALGQSDRAYALLRSRTFPSWGYMLDQGATTFWERWDAFTPETGFANHARASFNHTPFATFVNWLFADAAGIRALEPGFRRLEFAPHPSAELAWLEASHDSVRGRLRLRWEWKKEELRLAVEVPPNVSARLVLEEPFRFLVTGAQQPIPGKGPALELEPGTHSLVARRR
jgi:alpha-L-rhamnosidase